MVIDRGSCLFPYAALSHGSVRTFLKHQGSLRTYRCTHAVCKCLGSLRTSGGVPEVSCDCPTSEHCSELGHAGINGINYDKLNQLIAMPNLSYVTFSWSDFEFDELPHRCRERMGCFWEPERRSECDDKGGTLGYTLSPRRSSFPQAINPSHPITIHAATAKLEQPFAFYLTLFTPTNNIIQDGHTHCTQEEQLR